MTDQTTTTPVLLLPKQQLTMILLSCVAILSGCGGPSQNDVLTENRLKSLANTYLGYAVAKRVGPANDQELRKYMQAFGPPRGGANDSISTNNGDAFRSARDGHSFVVRYGLPISVDGSTIPIAYESEGVDGTRYVAFTNGKVQCVTEEEFEPIIEANE